jgi:O-antigen ligase
VGAAAVGCALFVPLGKAPFNVFFGVGLLAFVAVAVLDPRRARAAFASPVVLGALALAAAYAASLAWTIGPMEHALDELASYRVLLTPLVFAPALVDARWRHATLSALLISLGVVLAFSLVQAVHPLPFARGTLDPAARDALGQPVRDAAVFSDRIRQSVHLSVLFLWAAGLALLHPMAAGRRALLVLLAVVCAIDMLFLVAGRTGYLTVTAVLLYLLGLRFGLRGLLGVGVAVGLVAGAASMGLPVVSARAAATVEELRAWLATGQVFMESGVANASGQRLAMWSQSVRMIADAPVLGHGIDSYRELARGFQLTHGVTTAELYHDPHNEWLYVGVELGLAGVLLLMVLLAGLWRLAGGLDGFWRWFMRGTVVIYLAAGLANCLLNVGWTGYFFGLLLALFAGRLAAHRGRFGADGRFG